MTVADTLYDVIKDNWGGGGYGGATPTFAITESVLSTDMVSADLIQVQAYSVREEPQVVNDVYTDRFYFCDIYISSKTTAAQLKLLEDEAEYLLRNTAMTSLQLVNIRKDHSVTKWEQARHAVRLIVEVVSLMSSGAITPASTTTGYNWLEANMIGSANAAWVPCTFLAGSTNTVIAGWQNQITNTGATDPYVYFVIPQPTNRGTLKLYISGIRVVISDADDAAFVSTLYFNGVTSAGQTTIKTDSTNRTTPNTYDYTWTAEDVSSYNFVGVTIYAEVDAANELEFMVLAHCYYDT